MCGVDPPTVDPPTFARPNHLLARSSHRAPLPPPSSTCILTTQPPNLTTNQPQPPDLLGNASIRDVRRWRESELVHGRVAMLAALGFIVGENLEDFPAFYNLDGHIAGPAIYQFQQVEARGGVFWEPLVLAIGLAETWRVAVGWATPTGTGFNSLKVCVRSGLGSCMRMRSVWEGG